MFAETCFVQVRCTLHLAVVVGALCGFVNFEGSLARLRHVCAHESGRVLLELGALGLDLESLVVEEGGCVLLEDARLSVHICGAGLGRTSSGRNLETNLRLFSTEEGCFVCVEDRAGRAGVVIIATKERIGVVLVAFTLHFGWNDSALDVLELVTKCSLDSGLSLSTSVKEFRSGSVNVRSCVGNFILEEPLLSLLKGSILRQSLRARGTSSLNAACLVQLVIAQFADFRVAFNAIEVCIGLHHGSLLVLGQIRHSAFGSGR